jgi:hypothetical protein
MRLKSFSYALSRLSAEFRYPIFFYERSGSDFARIFCAVARHLVHQTPTDQGRGGMDSKTAHSAMATPATFSLAGLIAETNPECTRSANEIAVGTHGFEFAYRFANFDRADLRPGECDHFSEFTCSDKFHRCCAED